MKNLHHFHAFSALEFQTHQFGHFHAFHFSFLANSRIKSMVDGFPFVIFFILSINYRVYTICLQLLILESGEIGFVIYVLYNYFFAGRPIIVDFSPVTDFREATCRQYEENMCNRGGYCNFMHLKRIGRYSIFTNLCPFTLRCIMLPVDVVLSLLVCVLYLRAMIISCLSES